MNDAFRMQIDHRLAQLRCDRQSQRPRHVAFGNRRKTLKNALTASRLGIDSQTALEALKSAGIDPYRRAETLKPAEFVSLEISLREAMAQNEG